MKFTDFTILFSCILLCFILAADINTNELQALAKLQIQYNNRLDNAVQDSIEGAVELDSGRQIFINKQEVVDRFFESLSIQFGVLDKKDLVSQLKGYVPVILFVEQEGYFLYCREDKNGILEEKFSTKIPFLLEREKYTIQFTLGDYIYYWNKQLNKRIEGNYYDINFALFCPELEQEVFEIYRRRTIIDTLTQAVNQAIKEHNKIAEQYGIDYVFSLPVIEKELWYRTIDDVSLLVLFQGYPYGNGITGFYNRVALGGARLTKEKEERSK